MYKITAICNYQGSSLEGQRIIMWCGNTKKAAEKWFTKFQNKHGKMYSDYKIEIIEVKNT